MCANNISQCSLALRGVSSNCSVITDEERGQSLRWEEIAAGFSRLAAVWDAYWFVRKLGDLWQPKSKTSSISLLSRVPWAQIHAGQRATSLCSWERAGHVALCWTAHFTEQVQILNRTNSGHNLCVKDCNHLDFIIKYIILLAAISLVVLNNPEVSKRKIPTIIYQLIKYFGWRRTS